MRETWKKASNPLRRRSMVWLEKVFKIDLLGNLKAWKLG